MKKEAVIANLANEGIEGLIATTIDSPVYLHKGLIVYGVDNIPSICYKTASKIASEALVPYFNALSLDQPNPSIEKAIVVKQGKIIDKKLKLIS
jgi:alanine dehydrogenase